MTDSITWADALLYELEGRATVEVDIATERLERVLARIRRAPVEERTRVMDRLDAMIRQAEFDHARAIPRVVEAEERVREWEERVAQSKGELAAQARERVEDAKTAAAEVAAEAAEYAAIVARLEEARTLIESAK